MSHGIQMGSMGSDQYRGWAFSLAFHLLVGAITVTAMPKLALVTEKEPFKWDVALVERVQEISSPDMPTPAPAAQPSKPLQSQPARPVEPTTDMVTTPVAPRQSVQVVHPIIEPPKPIEQTVDPLAQKVEPVERKIEPPQPKVEPVVQKVVEVEKPKVEPVERKIETRQPAIEPVQEKVVVAEQPKAEPVQPVVEVKVAAPVVTAEPIVPQGPAVAMAVPVKPALPPSLAATSEPPKHSGSSSGEAETEHEATPLQKDLAPIRRSLAPVGGDPAPREAKPSAAPSAQSSDESGVIAAVPGQTEPTASIVAKATPIRPATKADYAWLAESLGRRIAALTRYPSSARLNGWEGRVVLRAVIRADGHLLEVTVHRSSGHDALDRAALETIKLACPLHMKHSLNTAEVAIYVPIVYSLAG